MGIGNDMDFEEMAAGPKYQTESKRYRKIPVEITAYQTDVPMVVHTLEGDMQANPGDWIITGIAGETYPCKNDIFKATYEEVKEENN